MLKRQGVLAFWSYNVVSVAPEIDRITDRFYRETVGPFWPPERAIVETGYRTIDFPFHEIDPPLFRMETRWKLDQLLGYLRTWSATQKFIVANNFDPFITSEANSRKSGRPTIHLERLFGHSVCGSGAFNSVEMLTQSAKRESA